MRALEEQIRAGLSARPRRLPAALLYDALGSTLFEAITLLPEYQVTRADLALLARHAGALYDALGGPLEVLELGPGAGRKAALLLSAFAARQPALRFVAVDVSATALAACQDTLEALPGVSVELVEATYLEGLRAAAPTAGVQRLVTFLGSNLSNFERPEAARFLRDVRAALRPGDALLLATDLDKPAAQLLPAYDDALGVTAAFNRNVVARLARDYGATLAVGDFAHRARWNEAERRIEMHLEALRPVRAEVLGVPLALSPGETLWTESSHRFTCEELRGWGEAAGFVVRSQWREASWAFAHTLFVVPGA